MNLLDNLFWCLITFLALAPLLNCNFSKNCSSFTIAKGITDQALEIMKAMKLAPGMDIPIYCLHFFLELNSALYEQKLFAISPWNNLFRQQSLARNWDILTRNLQLFRILDISKWSKFTKNCITSKDAHKMTYLANKRITRGLN